MEKDRDGSYGELDLGTIQWDYFYDTKTETYHLNKALQSICYRNISANDVAKILDKYMKVNAFSEQDGTLYIRCVLR